MHGMTWVGWTSIVLGGALAGCGGGSGGSASATESGGSSSDGATTQASAAQTTSGASDSEGPTTGASGMSMSGADGTGEPTTGVTSTTSMTSMTSMSGSTSDETGTGTTEGVSVSESDSDTGGTTLVDTTGDESGTGDAESSTGPGCIPSPEICNDIDDDCDDQIDNVDVGKDGICDCLNIALIGNEGANPSAEFQGWLEAQGTQVDRINTQINEPLDKATLSKYDIIILDWLVRPYTADEQSAVQNWVEAGGGLMSMTGHTNNNTVIDRPNSLIKPMGLAYNGSKGFFSGPIMMFAMHEITQGLGSLSFFGGLYIDIVEDGVGKNQVIMTLPQGPVGVVQERIGGRLFIFGDEWIEFDSEWKNIPAVKQMWVQTLSYLGPKESCQVPQ